MAELLTLTDRGLYCATGDFFIDPWKPVDKALITHAHSDHARPGMRNYIAQKDTVPVLKLRLGEEISVQAVDYEKSMTVNGVKVSFHPAGHIIGSAQVRVEYKGEVYVVSGDYKTEDDRLASPFEPVKCDVFITESTFGLPVYKWHPQHKVIEEINNWWARNKEEGKASVLTGYSLGKAQRLLFNIDASIGPIYGHGAICRIMETYDNAGYDFPKVAYVDPQSPRSDYQGALIIAPPSAIGSPWVNRFRPYSTAMASGWMLIRGMKRRRAADVGFVLSDHADWDGLNRAIEATGAEKVWTTHGYTEIFSKWLREKGYNARELQTEFTGENEEESI